ncbi:hypothetical protein [Ruficoccus sp. ZRK36]|uniref:hypothetical protein n=1 Tax=Ruficoccus sp. ZRK36 TaxID=2866311 RepID=UPI001C72C70C|nr:hypothetical protein [Ruficoccus sp. ZRK36]QYY35155.1 hypothetical protein K0V07_12720 [Ruficoccus sp. ZRK36]
MSQREFEFIQEYAYEFDERRRIVWGNRKRLKVDEVYKVIPDHLSDSPALYAPNRREARMLALRCSAMPGKGFVLVFKGPEYVERMKV